MTILCDLLSLPQYHIRYLTLTSDQVRAGQAATNLLTEEEEINILFSILYLGANLPKHLQVPSLL